MATRLLSLIVAPLLMIGCTQSPATPTPVRSLHVPTPKRVEISCYFDDKELPPKTFLLDESQANQIVTCLNKVRWKSGTASLAEIKLVHPDVAILLTDETGRQHTFQFYWSDESFLDQQQGLLLTSTDLSGLRREVTAITGLNSTPSRD